MAVREADENKIAVSADAPDILHALQLHIIQARKMRIKAVNLLSRVAFRGDMHHFSLRVTVEQPQELCPCVARSPQYAYFHGISSRDGTLTEDF